MEPFDSLVINNVSIKVRNRTDYFLEDWLYADYGFELFYIPRKTDVIDEEFWRELVVENGFQDPDQQYRHKTRYHQLESRQKELDFRNFLTRNFCLEWTTGKTYYGILYDYKNSTLLMDTGKTFRERL